ncbi:SRPBCC family protein [Conexibacter sp. SYSU D00693]|uniref:SRPBCC family protein n=1 Tax=Conexibacter sp. SYSU D00693 TaxID=2812560 RepID=UPI00196B7BCD|nr:SRPBCC family protein [Conexibacter sp. SYSU D00693]
MRVTASIDVSAPPEAVWAFVDDPTRYLEFMRGVTRWEVVGEQRSGCGTRVRTLLQVGSAEVGGLVEVVEHVPCSELSWVSITGADQRGRWRLRTRRPGRTTVELRLAYGVAGSGLLGAIAERLAAPQIRGHLRRSLQQLKRQVESEQLRATAAQRRAARQRVA